MPTSLRFVVRSTLGFLLVGFMALLGIVATNFWLGERAGAYFDDAIEARDTRGAAVELRNAVLTAESSQRGFLYTGNEIYLAPYDTAKNLAQRQLDALKRLLKPYRQSDTALTRLTGIIAEKFGEMDRTVALKRDRRESDAAALMRTNHGKALMDEANVYFSGVIRSADERLTKGVAEQRENAVWLRTVSIIGAVVIVAVVGGAALSLVRYMWELRLARDEVRNLNTGLEQRVKNRTADLARANEEMQRFTYFITHDLRAPLISIMGFAAELENGLQDLTALAERSADFDAADPLVRQARAACADVPEAIGFIRSSITKMDGLIRGILQLSREGQRTLRPEPLDLGELVQACVAAIRHQVITADGEIEVEMNVPPLYADRLSLEQIIGNLLDNAVKYRAKSRPLRIGVRARTTPGDQLVLQIADNGRGIAAEDHERVFELFRRAGAQDQPGEGIGLAHISTVVRNLGGEISLTSALDRGSTFRVVLPLTRQAAESLAA